MIWLRNATALPLMGIALVLWFVSSQLADLSKFVGDCAGMVAGPQR